MRHDIQIVVGGESKNRRTAALVELRPGSRHSLTLSVYPESSGEAVPLVLSIEYQDESRIPYMITTEAAVCVVGRDQAPIDNGGTVIRIDKLFQHAGRVNIGENIVTTSVGNDGADMPAQSPSPPITLPASAWRAPRDEPSAVGGPRGASPRLPDPSSPSAAGAGDCPVCGTRNDAAFKFCSNCGHRLAPKPAVCASCGAPLKEKMKFCGECGTPAPAS